MDLTAISSAATGFKVAVDMAKGLQALNTSTEVRLKTSELLDAVLEARFKLLDASDTQSALLERIKDLEQQIAGFEDWNREKERYHLQAIDRGAFAYMHKNAMDQSEPPIWLCQTCFERSHKSPLQFRAQDRGSGASGGRGSHSRWGCNLCKAEVVVHYHRNPAKPWEPTPPDQPEPPPPAPRQPTVDRGESSWVTARRGR